MHQKILIFLTLVFFIYYLFPQFDSVVNIFFFLIILTNIFFSVIKNAIEPEKLRLPLRNRTLRILFIFYIEKINSRLYLK
jgi:hypothetical protein